MEATSKSPGCSGPPEKLYLRWKGGRVRRDDRGRRGGEASPQARSHPFWWIPSQRIPDHGSSRAVSSASLCWAKDVREAVVRCQDKGLRMRTAWAKGTGVLFLSVEVLLCCSDP
ncbi:hypothetical protein NDU88_005558 [Pleurodeles waltl]|uniref:Uncharacterized protein n=1 Tax=Pleurodeles waltl TaxID=8319 RepID=A0AAV7PGA3_PLEWA|nr:hypothetical protein NDU88_005558 [Pleurodeles waltl]